MSSSFTIEAFGSAVDEVVQVPVVGHPPLPTASLGSFYVV